MQIHRMIIAYFNDLPVGALVCHREAAAASTKVKSSTVVPTIVRITNLCVLEAYRNQNLRKLHLVER